MSDFSKEMVEHVAHLARLSFSEDELSRFSRQLTEIISYVEKLNELDTDKVAPLGNPFEITREPRSDVPQGSLPVEKILENAPVAKMDHFVIPKVI
jgi:aspartyl-tRNA(Asn)/glutamyl-tRNA(Gln) amidotransferase subunit C